MINCSNSKTTNLTLAILAVHTEQRPRIHKHTLKQCKFTIEKLFTEIQIDTF